MAMDDDTDITCVDCDAGRKMGCHSFCCRLLVRLRPEEMTRQGEEGLPPKGFVDKDVDGLCVHFERETGLCAIWEDRPITCREYECNSDFLLQVVLREGFESIVKTARSAASAYIPRESYITIPLKKSN